jgi:hypothetical protein
MYWPNGVPRVYAINGPGIPITSHIESEAKESGTSEEERSATDHNVKGEEPETESAWANEAITGLCISRSGHIFATMTVSSIAIWQTRV